MSLSSLTLSPASTGALYRTPPGGTGQTPTPAQQQQIRALQQRDADVRRHEQAHLTAAGGLALSGASYTYQQGPDGRRYAIGGEVRIDLSSGSDPQDTLQRARQIRAAALAPADPSAQDRQVAQQASRMEQQAAQEISRQNSATGGHGLLERTSSPGQYVDIYA